MSINSLTDYQAVKDKTLERIVTISTSLAAIDAIENIGIDGDAKFGLLSSMLEKELRKETVHLKWCNDSLDRDRDEKWEAIRRDIAAMIAEEHQEARS